MKFVTTYFKIGTGNLGDYERLFHVFKQSVFENSPHEIVELKVEIPEKKLTHSESMVANHYKMVAWDNYIKTVDDDCILIDCDMLVLKDMGDVFKDFTFDIALTKRARTSIPYNGGVVFVRNTPQAKSFIKQWRMADQRMYEDRRLHAAFHSRYRGMNQSALGYLLTKIPHGAKVIDLPCTIYNACEEDWKDIDFTKTYAIHCKANLKRAVLGMTQQPELQRVVDLWANYESKVLDKDNI